MGISLAACNSGILLAFIAGSLLGGLQGIRMVFASSLMAGALGAIVALFIREPKTARQPAQPTGTLSILRSKLLIFWSLLGLGLQAIASATVFSFTASYLKQFTDSALLQGLCASIFIASSVLFSVLAGRSRRLSNRILISILFAILLLYCTLMPFTTAIWQICLLQAAAGVGNGGLMTLLMALSLTGVDSRGKTTAMGFFQGVYSVGMMLGPALMGALIENGGGYIAGYLAMAFIALVSIVAVQFVRPCA
jgi:predicted MFS family arabinose efflux permease